MSGKKYWIIGLIISVVGAYYLGKSRINSDASVVGRTDIAVSSQTSNTGGIYDYTQAPGHIGEYATVNGRVIEVFTSKSNTTFLDFCSNYKSCQFSGVIFSSDKAEFSNLSQYSGKDVSVTGLIKSYQGRAEIIINSPDQIKIIQ